MLLQTGQKTLNGFKLGTFIGRFPSGDVTSMAVEGLTGESAGNDVLNIQSEICVAAKV